jgi:hypothetical protein
MSNMIRIGIAAGATAGVLLLGIAASAVAEPIVLAQYYGSDAACPPGYDGTRGYCRPNRNYGGYAREHRRYYRGYNSYGAACPPGYDGSSGRCVRNYR